jgi:hypothetical protein
VVPFTQGNVEALGQVKDHLAARSCPAGLDKAEMSGRDCRSQRELELAEIAPLSPLT